MNGNANPFQELYVTDSADPHVFVSLFSDLHIPDALPLFSPGNVVLKGTQGSGKSMLLNLLKPEIRLAYYNARRKFPVPLRYSKFIGAGINLTRSGILDLGQRPITKKFESEDEAEFPLLFGDFLNYWVVRDLLESLEVVMANEPVFCGMADSQRVDSFAKTVAKRPCWFGYLDGCSTFDELKKRIDYRIVNYRSFMNYSAELDSKIRASKTNVGEPIAQTADCLKLTKVIPPTTEVQIRIDQVERLIGSDTVRRNLGRQYRRIINKAISLRDSRISYNLGTRRHAWEDELGLYGSDDNLEILRDYRIVDLDQVLLRREDRTGWLFPTFAEDALKRRVVYASMSVPPSHDMVAALFGARHSYRTAAKDYSSRGDPLRILSIDSSIPKNWREFLLNTFSIDPFEAFVAICWARQKGGEKTSRLERPPPAVMRPWSKQWWLKERIRQAMVQIAAKSAQRLRWSGKDQILALSSGNISMFLSICHECWDVFQRSVRADDDKPRGNPFEDGMDRQTQSVGIYNACEYWYQKINERPLGDNRKRFVDYIGSKFRAWLLEDDAMSYPGWNGFSVDENELRECVAVDHFINDLVDYGELVKASHTPKTKGLGKRVKFYLSPILSPQFQIPETHVKEPYYVEIPQLCEWISDAGVILEGLPIAAKSRPQARAGDSRQLTFGL